MVPAQITVMKALNLWTRKLHRWGAILFALPLLLVIVTGLLLQLKKQVTWVQPPTQKGMAPGELPLQNWAALLEVVRKVPEADVKGWSDIDRLDVRPGKGVAKIRCVNRWEIQVDLTSGEVLSSTYRRSDLIESLHDGSFFSEYAKLGIFLPNGLILLVLWVSGLWLWYLPHRNRFRNQKL